MNTDKMQYGSGDSSELVEAVCLRTGTPFRAEYSTEQVIQLLNNLEYAVDRAELCRQQRLGYIPAIDGSWSHERIHQLIGSLEARRKWQPNSGIHRLKKSAALREFEESGQERLNDVDKHTLEDLLLWMLAASNHELREAFHLAIQHKLIELGFVE